MKKRIVTGDRPTSGNLHLGHYVGSLASRLELQAAGEELFVFIADLHTLTTAPTKERVAGIDARARGILLDYLSVGLDPEKTTFYRQSRIAEIPYLALLFGMLVSEPRLERLPTLKEVMRDLKLESASYGLLGYPVLMSADILMVKGTHVPVGEDQQAHVELTREIARKFNSEYGNVFPEPEVLLSKTARLIGTDGKAKMSKSLGNAISLSDNAARVEAKVTTMYTDPNRVHGDEPGTVEGNPVFVYLDAFANDKHKISELKERYRKGTIKDVEVKRYLAQSLNTFLEPIRKRREEVEGLGEQGLDDIFEKGEVKVKKIASETLGEAKTVMGL